MSATTSVPRRRIVGFSAKMYFTSKQTSAYIDELLKILRATDCSKLANIDIFMIPDHLTIQTAIEGLGGDKQTMTGCRVPDIWVGSQDCFWEDAGAYTGEVSPKVLSELGCRVVELGHAERRRIFGETDEQVSKKAAAVVRNCMTPLVCIGERTKAFEDNEAEVNDTAVATAVSECKTQIVAVIEAVPTDSGIVFAYEPVWAIGAQQPAGAKYVTEVVKSLRQLECLRSRTGETRIIYGGSAGPGLYEELKDELDGLFLGRFAHDPERFVKTIQEIADA